MKKWLECLLFLSLTLGLPAHAALNSLADDCEGYFKNDMGSKGMPFAGLTKTGLAKVVEQQDRLKKITLRSSDRFESMETIVDIALLNMAAGQNMTLLGPPGGAKSGLIRWLVPNLWVKQMHEMMTELALLGGQTAKGLAEGREDINTEGSAVDNEFVMLDEMNNANPQVFATAMSLANPGERDYTVQGKTKRSKIRAMFMTGNATRYEILTSFIERGMQSGPAFLNRSAFKVYVRNWLHPDGQERRDAYIKEENQLRSIQRSGTPEARKAADEMLEKMKSVEVDWDVVSEFAQQAFVTSEELDTIARDFANRAYVEINAKVKGSEQKQIDNPNENLDILTPAAEWTERFRGEILRIAKYSAALDYLRAVGPEALDPKRLSKPITLGPLSLWRAYSLTTTVTSGITRLDPKSLKVEFNLLRTKAGKLIPLDRDAVKTNSRDKRAETELKDMFEEQDWFNDTIHDLLSTSSQYAKEISLLLNQNPMKAKLENTDFEVMMYHMRPKEK